MQKRLHHNVKEYYTCVNNHFFLNLEASVVYLSVLNAFKKLCFTYKSFKMEFSKQAKHKGDNEVNKMKHKQSASEKLNI